MKSDSTKRLNEFSEEIKKKSTILEDKSIEMLENRTKLSEKLIEEKRKPLKKGFFRSLRTLERERLITINSLEIEVIEADNEIKVYSLNYRLYNVKQIRIARAMQIINEFLHYINFHTDKNKNSKLTKKYDENILAMCKANNITYFAAYALYEDYFYASADDEHLDDFINRAEIALIRKEGYLHVMKFEGIQVYENSQILR